MIFAIISNQVQDRETSLCALTSAVKGRGVEWLIAAVGRAKEGSSQIGLAEKWKFARKWADSFRIVRGGWAPEYSSGIGDGTHSYNCEKEQELKTVRKKQEGITRRKDRGTG
jgi:hypothetical protein